MQYILTQNEYDALTSVKRLQEANEALEVARKLIMSDEDCDNVHYCDDCLIGGMPIKHSYDIQNLICIRSKRYSK